MNPRRRSLARVIVEIPMTAARSKNVSPKVSNPRVPYTISFTGSVVCQAPMAIESA